MRALHNEEALPFIVLISIYLKYLIS